MGMKIRIVGFNSSILAADNEDREKLSLGNKQLGLAFIENGDFSDETEAILVLSHHPIQGNWLADEKEVQAQVLNQAHLHLFGQIGNDVLVGLEATQDERPGQ